MNQDICPVPTNQQPTYEFVELSKSWFFSSPIKRGTLIKLLSISWIISLIICLIIASGSINFNYQLMKYIYLSIRYSLILPLLILFRQWLGWKHIYKRLSAHKVEYEETGWYDGQEWEKPFNLRDKELLIAYKEVRPILTNIRSSFLLIISLLLVSFYVYPMINL
tara:strand:- start:113 stop:607 length:495 start_codon:yes stop_codon:yes gene_type:complete